MPDTSYPCPNCRRTVLSRNVKHCLYCGASLPEDLFMRHVGERFVDESDLDFSKFNCCGDQDLYPFCCTSCGRFMVFCYECDTLYPDLKTLIPGAEVNSIDPKRPIFHCPQCGFGFEYHFMENSAYHARQEDWREAGLSQLLISK